jgi:hypothetical protein
VSEQKPDLLRDLQRTCLKLEAAIQECERLLEASPLVIRSDDVPNKAPGYHPENSEAVSTQKVER